MLETVSFDREDLRFENGDALETPAEIGEFVDHFEGLRVLGLERIAVALEVGGEIGGVLGREEAVGGGEPVGNGVAGGDGFALWGGRSCGKGGILAVGFDFHGGHCGFPFCNKNSARQRGALE